MCGCVALWSLAALGCLAAVLAAWFVCSWRKTRLTLLQYGLLLLNHVFARLLWRATIDRRLPIADDVGAVIVSNHRSSVEPLLIQLTTNRVVHWMVAREYVEAPYLRVLFRALQAIPVGRRGIDTASTKLAIRHAKEGRLVGIFPEGRINTGDDVLLSGRPGAALVALKAGVPVIPCYVEGAPYRGKVWEPLYTPARVKVRVGEPIDVGPYLRQANAKAAQQELTLRMMREIAALAGAKDFEPQLAGRTWLPADDSQE